MRNVKIRQRALDWPLEAALQARVCFARRQLRHLNCQLLSCDVCSRGRALVRVVARVCERLTGFLLLLAGHTPVLKSTLRRKAKRRGHKEGSAIKGAPTRMTQLARRREATRSTSAWHRAGANLYLPPLPCRAVELCARYVPATLRDAGAAGALLKPAH